MTTLCNILPIKQDLAQAGAASSVMFALSYTVIT